MATQDKKVLVLNPLTGELQQQQADQTVFGLAPNETAAKAADLQAEVTARGVAEAALQSAITAEATRAQAAEATLTTAVATEKTRAEGVEADLAGKIGDLTALTTAQKGSVVSAINDVVSTVASLGNTYATDAELAAAVQVETDRALAAEGVLTTAVAAEKTRAEGAEAALQTAINDEAAARTAADNALQAQINALGSAFNYVGTVEGGADEANAFDLGTLAAGGKNTGDYYKVATAGYFKIDTGAAFYANAGDGLVWNMAGGVDKIDNTDSSVVAGSNITVTGSTDVGFTVAVSDAFAGRVSTLETGLASEATTRASADTTLQSNIDAEASARAAADTVLDGKIATEATARADADTAINATIGTLTDLTTSDKTTVVAAINSVKSDINNIGANYATKAELSAEATARADADTALAGDVADLQAELDDTQAGAGLAIDGSYVVDNTTTYIKTATSLANADKLLDTQVKATADALAFEISRAQAAETSNATAIANEVTRATAAEGTLTTNLAAEVTRATAAEATLTSDLAAEVTRAKGVEGTLTDLTTTNKSNLVAAINEVKQAADAAGVGLQAELDRVETAVGLNADGTLTAFVGNYIAGQTAVVGAVQALDSAAKTEADRALAAESDLQDAIDAEAARAQAAETTLTTAVATEKTRAEAAEGVLDGKIATEAAARAAADDLKVNKAGDTMSGDLVLTGGATVKGVPLPVNGTDAANKTYVDNRVSGISWREPVDSMGAALPGVAAAGTRFLNTTDGKIYTATADDTFDAGVTPTAAWAVFNKANESGWVYDADTSKWVQFTGAGQLVAGLGLKKTGNVIDLELDSNIALSLTSTDPTENGVLRLNLVAAGGLEQSAAGLKISDAGVTNTMLAGAITNDKLVNSKVTLNGVDVALGGSFTIDGLGAISVATNGTTSTVSVATASTTVKGVASFDAGNFSVADGVVSLNSTLGDLANVADSVDTAAAGSVLIKAADGWTVIAQSELVPDLALNDLTDVVAPAASIGDVLFFDGNNWVNGATGATSGVQAHGAGLDALAAKTSTGILVQTGDNTYESRAIAGTAGRVTVTNGDGAAAAPTIDLATTGVVAGSYNNVTVDAYGRVTQGANVEAVLTAISTAGLSVGDAVYVGANGVLAKAKADAGETVKVVGFVAANGAIATTGGTLDGFVGLTAGARYFLSGATAGAITTTPPTEGYVAPVGIAISATKLAINIGSPIQL